MRGSVRAPPNGGAGYNRRRGRSDPAQDPLRQPGADRPAVAPDGRRLAHIAPVDDVLNVWVGDARRRRRTARLERPRARRAQLPVVRRQPPHPGRRCGGCRGTTRSCARRARGRSRPAAILAAERAHPHVQDAVDRGDVRDPRAVGRYGRGHSLRVAEQHFSGDQIDHLAAIVSRRRRRPSALLPAHGSASDRDVRLRRRRADRAARVPRHAAARGLRLLRRLLARRFPYGTSRPRARARSRTEIADHLARRGAPSSSSSPATRRPRPRCRTLQRESGGAADRRVDRPRRVPRCSHAQPAASACSPRRRRSRAARYARGGARRSTPGIEVDAGRLPRPRAADPERRHPRDELSSRPCADLCAPLRAPGVDTVILGCTHYPLVRADAPARCSAATSRSSPPPRSSPRRSAATLARRGVWQRPRREGDYRFLCTGDAEAFRERRGPLPAAAARRGRAASTRPRCAVAA